LIEGLFMFQCKPISPDSILNALSKAERYRLLNEPGEAESICLDFLEIDGNNEAALIQLVLAKTDQFSTSPSIFSSAMETAGRLGSDYDRLYYEGIVWERRAKARLLHGNGHGMYPTIYEWLVNALHRYEEAERMRPHGNDDAILRWNACVRFLSEHKELRPQGVEETIAIVSE
jgi:hypothetical protein